MILIEQNGGKSFAFSAVLILYRCQVELERLIISPLLANVYLDIMDEWVSKQWEAKGTRFLYANASCRYEAMRKRSRLIPGYLVRYADDFVIITDTHAHAEDWKARLQIFLHSKMKLTLFYIKNILLRPKERINS